jgi:hypothetical protein
MSDTRVMSAREQDEHHENTLAVRSALSALRLTRIEDEDVAVAKARLENWLAENDGRWTR